MMIMTKATDYEAETQSRGEELKARFCLCFIYCLFLFYVFFFSFCFNGKQKPNLTFFSNNDYWLLSILFLNFLSENLHYYTALLSSFHNYYISNGSTNCLFVCENNLFVIFKKSVSLDELHSVDINGVTF